MFTIKSSVISACKNKKLLLYLSETRHMLVFPTPGVLTFMVLYRSQQSGQVELFSIFAFNDILTVKVCLYRKRLAE